MRIIMSNKLERKYGLFTAICMVVGIVIGSGVFFKAQTILQKTGGNMPMGILAWLIGGAIMLVCLLTFAFMGQKYERVNGLVDYAVIGIGINCLQKQEDFPAEISQMATSLFLAAKKRISPDVLAAAMIEALWKLSADIFTRKGEIMDRYRENCITLGKDIQVIRENSVLPGKAVGMDNDGGLLVEYVDGSVKTVSSGEVSVRGMYGYV